jgi:hypothetical protein
MAWVWSALAVAGASLIGPIIVVVAPFLLLGGACLLSALHTRATELPTCVACDKFILGRSEARTFAPPSRTELPRAA